MSQRQQLERIMEIDRRIRQGDYPNADRMAEILEVSRRVIFNDRSFMVYRLGAPIEFDRVHGGWYYTDQTWSLPGIYVTQGELMAFFLSLEIAKRYIGTDLESPLRSAVEKITKAVRGAVSVDTNALRDHYSFSKFHTITINENMLIDLHQAILKQQQIWIRYLTAKRNQITERTVYPYHLHNFQGDWFLIAFDTLRNDYRTFLVGRIQHMKPLPIKFDREENFSVEAWIESAFQVYGGDQVQQVSIWFNPQKAHFIRERLWHPSQQIEEQEDGSLVLTMQTGGLTEVRNWVLQFGAAAEICAPESLRQEILAELRMLTAKYQKTR